jgi:hypothetical protein
MFTRISPLLGSIALAVAAWAPHATAVVVSGGFSGTIFQGSDFSSDPAGYFGAGADLSDLPIVGTFRYDTDKVPPASSSGANSAIYSDPAFATDFLVFSVTISGRRYEFGTLSAPPGLQSIDLIDNTDQLQFDYQRYATDATEAISLRFISDLDFLNGTGVPTSFGFSASGVGLTPGGSFSFDLPNGDFASASFSIESGFAQPVPETSSRLSLMLGLLALAGAGPWARGRRDSAAQPPAG